MRRLLVPSLVDIFFFVLLLAAFARPDGWQSLLADGDTGWHIRTGQLILESGRVPVVDEFSFSRPGEPWFAWEWLADVIFALLFARRGLTGVTVMAALVLCFSAAVLLAWLLRRGAGLWPALVTTLAAASASTVHYIARPHVFSILLYTVTLWIVNEDRRAGRRWFWLLIPLSALWANLHAAFVVLPATLALSSIVFLACSEFAYARRHGVAAILSLAATLLNPYGWRLHEHILRYLNSSWILNHVQEFQSPVIRSESMVVFALLLLAGVALSSQRMARSEWFEAALLLGWAFAALRSARHIPFFAIAAAPVIASEVALGWQSIAERSPGRSPWRIQWALSQDLGRWRQITFWLPLLGVLAVLSARPALASFPERHFPIQAVERNLSVLAPAGKMPRILSSDQWADYLIFRLYPRQRVFFDGRSDFYGPGLGSDYRELLGATGKWRELLDRHGFDLALLPRDWALSTVLVREPGWTTVYQDRLAVLCRREPAEPGPRGWEP